MRIVALVISLLLINSCTSITQQRSEITTDSGRPLSEGLKSYDIENLTLRLEVLVEEKAIAGSAAIHFMAQQSMSKLELDFIWLIHYRQGRRRLRPARLHPGRGEALRKFERYSFCRGKPRGNGTLPRAATRSAPCSLGWGIRLEQNTFG